MEQPNLVVSYRCLVRAILSGAMDVRTVLRGLNVSQDSALDAAADTVAGLAGEIATREAKLLELGVPASQAKDIALKGALKSLAAGANVGQGTIPGVEEPVTGREVAAWRSAKGLKQAEAGARFGISQTTWSKIELGKEVDRSSYPELVDAVRSVRPKPAAPPDPQSGDVPPEA